jgi:carboxymethylenebutenolidase
LSLPETTSDKVGTVGFCMGGQLSLYAACDNPKVGACVDYYGIHPSVKPNVARLQAPVLGFFGATDPYVTPEAARQLKAELESKGKRAEFHVYDGAGHAFFNDSRLDAYDRELAQDSWLRMLAFYREHLGD